ncbi:hypothetical protein NDU88_002920 [Pleurodeles waltl]|uniref:Uncharacterized protein n=1 Tax=Pleurodeles waltl TaxID=8319 RepID=A0AAV7NGP6_PLEWA|nr:hypothetical protein NDU88_002920 [Pleurodeles waltl]
MGSATPSRCALALPLMELFPAPEQLCRGRHLSPLLCSARRSHLHVRAPAPRRLHSAPSWPPLGRKAALHGEPSARPAGSTLRDTPLTAGNHNGFSPSRGSEAHHQVWGSPFAPFTSSIHRAWGDLDGADRAHVRSAMLVGPPPENRFLRHIVYLGPHTPMQFLGADLVPH